MDEIQQLKRSLISLKKSVSGFPLGAVTLDDLKPIEVKIRGIREALKCLNSRMKMLKIKTNLENISQPPENEISETMNQLQLKLSDCIINNNALMSCYYTEVVQKVFFKDDPNDLDKKHIRAIMLKLYHITDTISIVNEELEELLNKELKLKDDCGQLIAEFHIFLKEQDTIRNKKLGESDPIIAENKEKQKLLIFKINLMKKLITNFISAASPHFVEDPELQNLLKKHRDLVTNETIHEMARNRVQDHED